MKSEFIIRDNSNINGIIQPPELSDWKCYMFGAKDGYGVVFIPLRGEEPNAIQRWFSGIFFKCKWVKYQ